MRAFLTTIASMALAACGGATTATNDPPPGQRPFPSERGVIVYQMTGQLSGDESITWDSWGMRSVTVTNTTVTTSGRTARQHTRTIITPDVTYAYSQETAGYVRINAGSRRMYGGGGQVQTLDLMEDAGTDTIAGLDCTRSVHRNREMGMEICMAGHLPLRVVTPPYGHKVATRVRLNPRVDPRIFEPDGVMVLDMEAPRAVQ